MKFLIDAHLPKRMCVWLTAAGCDALHTLDLPAGNRTPDEDIIQLADADGRIVVTKDEDFVTSHLVNGRPAKLLLVSTGNIVNADLERLLTPLLPTLLAEFASATFIELTRSGLIVRG
jgi:predicted nuclease of predicted toxin-antitoxin system